MALSKAKKADVVSEVTDLVNASKMTILADYRGVNVKSLQALRKAAKANGTTVKVIKNRLVIQALKNSQSCQTTDTSALKAQLLYAFNADDEVAPAQALNNFAKNEPNLQFVGAITADGQFIGIDDVKALASLPSKDQLRAQLIGTIGAGLSGFVNVLSGNLRGVLYVFEARANSLK
jgi:large subunit ribosomal protein L10